MKWMHAVPVVLVLLAAAPLSHADRSGRTHVTVFDSVAVEHDSDLPEAAVRHGYTLRREGQIAETVIDLPPAPADQRDAQQITATLEVTPRLVEHEGGYRPGDPWPRIGAVSVMVPEDGDMREVEIMRFITGFGGASTYTEDLTALAPLLHGRQTLRVFISTWADPAWEVTLTLEYCKRGLGFRRPAFALPVFNEEQVTAEENILQATVVIAEGLDRPRLRILSTGHATDGSGGDEFITRTHVLRINGEEIARWRPWRERGGSLRSLNPTSGRFKIDGREIWSSDLDRSGWHPGLRVWAKMIPVPELGPGEHEVELEIQGIRPKRPDDPDGHHGYWRTSAIVVADERWPGDLLREQ